MAAASTTPSTISRLVTGATVSVLSDFAEPSVFQSFEKYRLHVKITRSGLPDHLSKDNTCGEDQDEYYFSQWAKGRKLMREMKHKNRMTKYDREELKLGERDFDTVDGGVANKAFEDSEGLTAVVSMLPEGDSISKDDQEELISDIPEKCESPRMRNNEKRMAFLIHSFGESNAAWNHMTEVFTSRGFSVVAPDLIGHGFSGCPTKKKFYTFDNILENLLAVFDKQAKKYGSRAILCGHGYGAAFATGLARKRATSVDLMVLIDCGGPIPLAPLNNKWSRYPDLIYKVLQPLVKHGLIRRNRLFAPRGKSLCHESQNTSLPRYVASNYREGQHWPAGDISFHRRITQPCLLIHLSNDHISLVEMLEMERTLPRGYLEILLSDNQSRLKKIVEDFLDSFTLD